jgi:GNAT superfamily N-acetyltransferase
VSVDVRPVRTSRDRKLFLHFPWRIYPGRYPAWVPPLLMEEKKRLSRKANPFFEHGDVELIVAYRNGEPVGRIAAVENRLHNRVHEDRLGFFGQFECVEDSDVATALLEAAAEWVAARGLDGIRGPVNFSMNEECGLLMDAYDDPPTILMTYNPPYYKDLLEGWGMTKAKDLLAWLADEETFDADRFSRLEKRVVRSDRDLRIRSLDMKNFHREVELVRDLYNEGWEKNWGFVPMTDAEVSHMAKGLKPVVDPDLVLIGEIDGEPAGFALSLPDINQAIAGINGRLLPFGLLRMLRGMKKIDRIRILTLGVLPEHRRSGLDVLLYYETFKRGTDKGYSGESSWILEDNTLMNRALEKMGFKLYKTYRLYEKALPRPGSVPE